MLSDFNTGGWPHDVARSIEELARAQGHVTALVVPWESSRTSLTMAVTSVKADGWAIEHTNLGTITLTEIAAGTGPATRVAFTAHEPEHADRSRLAALFDRFAREVQSRFGAQA